MGPLNLGDDNSDSDGDLPETSSVTTNKDTISFQINLTPNDTAPQRPINTRKLRFIKDFLESELQIQNVLDNQNEDSDKERHT